MDEELLAASFLRAISFYAYPPERALAGKVRPFATRKFEIVSFIIIIVFAAAIHAL